MKIVNLIQQKWIMKCEDVDNYETDWLEKPINDKEPLHRKKNIGDCSLIISFFYRFLSNNSQCLHIYFLILLSASEVCIVEVFFARLGTGNLLLFGVSFTILLSVWFLICSIISNNNDLLWWVLEIFHFLLVVSASSMSTVLVLRKFLLDCNFIGHPIIFVGVVVVISLKKYAF